MQKVFTVIHTIRTTIGNYFDQTLLTFYLA